MASNHTQHYGLCQWEATDAVLRTDFNEDNQKIDTALKTQASNISDLTAQMANKANTGTVNSLAEEVALKADQSDLDAEKAAREAADTALAQSQTENMETLRGENCWVKLSDETLSDSAETYSFSIENPSQYAKLEFRYSMESTADVYLSISGAQLLPTGSNQTASAQILLIDMCERGMGGYLNVYPVGGTGHTIVECETGGLTSRNVFSTFDKTLCAPNFTFSRLRTLTLKSDRGAFAAGSRFILYGLKK